MKFLTLLFSGILLSQEVPPIINYSPNDYGAANQNWSISQSIDKNIYLANNDGLLEFNGAYWKLYPSPNGSIVRSVEVVGDRIYTGCFREFGFWMKDAFGNLEYESISDKVEGLDLKDEHFWNIIHMEGWILFQSLHNIYLINEVDNSCKIIETDSRLPKMIKVDDGIYFQIGGEGIYKIENGSPVLVSDDDVLKYEELVNIFMLNGVLMYQTQENGFYFLKKGKLSQWDISANEIILTNSVFSSIQLQNGDFMLGTISNGVYQLDPNGNIVMHINQKKGIRNNTVLSIFEDDRHNIWLGLDNGINMLNCDSPFRVYNDRDGELGSIYTSAIYKGNIYLGTNQGLYLKEENSRKEFKFIEGTEGQVWNLKVYDNTLFCGHNKGTFVVDGIEAKLISEVLGTWDILPIRNKDNLLLQGHYNGLNILEKKKDGWRLRNNISGFYTSSKDLAFNKDKEIFVAHEYNGIVKLVLNDDFTEVEQIIDEESALYGGRSSLIKFGELLVYTSSNGVFEFKEREKRFVKDSMLSSNIFGRGQYVTGKLVANELDKTLWGFTDRDIVFMSPGKINDGYRFTRISLPHNSRNFVAGYENVSKISERSYLFGTTNGYMVLNLDRLDNKDHLIRLNSIEKSTNKGLWTPVVLNDYAEFKNDEHNLNFKYSVVEYDKFNETYYQYQLEGIYDEWSKWTTSPEVNFSNLSFGNYEFRVRARIGNTFSSNVVTYSFKIDRPYYISNLAILNYSLFLILTLILIHRGYRKHYADQKIKLIRDNNKKMKLTKLENDQKFALLTNEQLVQDIDNKNNELAISTMSLVKKNQLLRTIKNEILHVEESLELKPVIKIIDDNLNNSNDWEFFQKAFNDADKDFFKKIHQVHPTLTPNDLKFCAYLRLNLSSKEIAPLLNISFRSVEIKRYRLRKKMGLAHEKSLIEYILEF